MTREQIRININNKIKKLGVRGAYKYIVVENAKIIKNQLPPMITDKDKFYLINLSHGISVKGLKDAGMFDKFNKLFVSDNVIKDEVWDYIINDLIDVVDNY